MSAFFNRVRLLLTRRLTSDEWLAMIKNYPNLYRAYMLGVINEKELARKYREIA